MLLLVFLPVSALEILANLNIVYPMLFELKNTTDGSTTHCGVLEFVAEEGRVYIPEWVRDRIFSPSPMLGFSFSLRVLCVCCVNVLVCGNLDDEPAQAQERRVSAGEEHHRPTWQICEDPTPT